MKLDPRLKSFYLRSLAVPGVGTFVLGPLLRGAWKAYSAVGDRLAAPRQPLLSISTYSSAIATLKLQLEALERRTDDLARELQEARWQVDYRNLLEGQAMGGLFERHGRLDGADGLRLLSDPLPLVPQAPRFSVVINTYNRAHTLERTLDGVRRLRYASFEVIVVDGPSTDGTGRVLERNDSWIRRAACPVANLSVSRNIGISMAAGDIVCFLDDDAVPEPGWLDQLLIGYREPGVAAVGGFIRDHTGHSFQSRAMVCDRFGTGTDHESVDAAAIEDDDLRGRYLSLTGTNCSFRRDVLVALGGFDEEYAYFLDETDVIVRLVDAGFKVRYVPAAEIHHKYAESHLRSVDRVPKTIYLPARSKAYFCFKNAIGTHRVSEIFGHLEQYRRGLRADYDWYAAHGRIDEAHKVRLHQDIDRGILDGIADALKPRRLMLRTDADGTHRAFKPVAPLRTAQDRIRLCLVSQGYPPHPGGGIGVWTHALATGMAAAGHEVTVVTRGGEATTVDFEDGVWVHRIAVTPHPGRTLPACPDLPQPALDHAYSVYDEVMRVHVLRGLECVSSPIWDLEGAACIADGSIPTVLSLHSSYRLVLPSKPEWQRRPDYLAAHVTRMIEGEAWAIAQASHVLANSVAITRDMEAAYGVAIATERLSVVPHGIDALPVVHASPAEADRAVRVLFVGRFEKRKGIDLLLACAPALLQAHPQLQLHLVGDDQVPFDTDRRILEEFSAAHGAQPWFARVHAHGSVSDAELQRHYAQCDIFVAPSRYESFGLVFIEAMRAGKPCVAIRAGGVPEVITDGVTGLLVPTPDADGLSRALARLIGDPRLRNELGANALHAFGARFTTGAMVAGCERAFKGVINAHRRGPAAPDRSTSP